MDTFSDFLSSHKRGILIASIVLLAIVALSVARCSSLAEQRAKEAANAQQSEEVRTNEDSKNTEASLTDEQKKLVANYSADESGFVKSLESYVWVSSNGSSAVTFSNNAFSLSRNGKSADARPFAVSALSGASISAEAGAASDDTSPTVASLLMDDGTTGIVSIERVPSNGSIGLAMTTDAFSDSRMVYMAERASDGVSVEGITDDAKAALGKDTNSLVKAIENHVESSYPTASSASWEGDLLLDYRNSTAQMSFDLDDARESKLVVTWHLDDNTFEFGGVR